MIPRVLYTLIAALILGTGSLGAGTAGTVELFSFATAGEAAAWSAVTDAVTGGKSQCKVFGTSEHTLRFLGSVASSSDGAFASARTSGLNIDLSGHAGIELRLRGDGRRYRLGLSNSATLPGEHASFSTVRGQWIVVRLPFTSFAPAPNQGRVFQSPPLDLRRIAAMAVMIADGQVGSFDLEIDWIRTYQLDDQTVGR